MGQAVHDGRQTDSVIGSVPFRALKRQAKRDRLIDFGKLKCLLTAIVQAGAHEESEIVRQLLLQIDGTARTRSVASDQGSVWSGVRGNAEPDRVVIRAHAPAINEAEQFKFAGSAPP